MSFNIEEQKELMEKRNRNKLDFLNTIEEESTKMWYLKILTDDRVINLEKLYNKDLCCFNRDEFVSLLTAWNSGSLINLNSIASVNRKYTNWCCVRGINPTRFNALDLIKRKDLTSIVSNLQIEQKYITSREELYAICDSSYNAQDAVIIALLFESIKGEALIDIAQLKVTDVDFVNNLIYSSGRVIKVHPKTIQIIQKAIDEKDYAKRFTGDVNTSTVSDSFIILPNDYVVRKAGKTAKNEPVSQGLINSRIKKVAKEIEYRSAKEDISNRPYLTPSSIHLSGLLVKFNDLAVQLNRPLTVDEYKKVIEEFGLQPNSYYSYKEVYLKVFKR